MTDEWVEKKTEEFLDVLTRESKESGQTEAGFAESLGVAIETIQAAQSAAQGG